MYSYSQIFRQALRIALKKPSFWFFGLFAAFLGSAGDFEILLGGYGFTGDNPLVSFILGLVRGGLFSVAGFQGLLENPFILFLLLTMFLITLGLVVLVVWLVIVSQSALIGQAVAISQGKDMRWRDAFSLGLLKFWPVLSLNFFVRIVATLLLPSSCTSLITMPPDSAVT